MATIPSPSIIFEDKLIIVLEKPAGMVVTREASNTKQENLFIEDWVGEYFPNGLPRKGIVHRLDKGTSGILLTAKDEASLKSLKKQFKNRQVEKHYVALVCGDTPKIGSILMPIERSRYVLQKFAVHEDGKRAETEFLTLKKYRIDGKIYSLVEINLKTGRTHQIRVHLSYLGWPLAGDKLYGAKDTLGLARPFLHSKYIKFVHPGENKEMVFESKLPNDLSDLIKNAPEY